MHRGDLSFGLDYAYVNRDRLFSGKKEIADSMMRESQSHLISFSTTFSITDHSSLILSTPYIVNRSQEVGYKETKSGFGDLSASLRFAISPTILSQPTNLRFALGASIPFGGGVVLGTRDDRNFASGTVDPLISIIAAYGLTPGWNLTGKFFTRQVVGGGSNSEKFGDFYSYALEIDYAPIGRDFTIYSGLSGISRGHDRLANQTFVNSGGDWINFVLGGSKVVLGEEESAVMLWSEIQLPVYRYVNGLQLAEKWNFRVGAVWGISLFGHDEDQGETEGLGLPEELQ